jgi:hypothetical protein
VGVLSRVGASCAALAIGQALFSGTPGHAAVVVNHLLVRVYDNAGVAGAERKRAYARANEILARVGLDAAWLECPARGFGWLKSDCNTPPAPGELVIRLVRTTPEARRHRPRALGYSLVDAGTGAATLATIFTDRVHLLAHQSQAERAAVLGRAIAHEIGHLILGTNGHSATGLMREHWTSEEIRRNRAEDWQFTRAERDTLHVAIRANAAALARAGTGAMTGSGGQNPHVLLNKTP